MIVTVLTTFLFFIAFLIVSIILLQQGKSDLTLGGAGKASQMLFGGSGGQDLFSKVTWALGFIFIVTSLLLAKVKNKKVSQSILSGYDISKIESDESELESETDTDTESENDSTQDTK